MSVPFLPEVLLSAHPSEQCALPAIEGVQRQSAFGLMLMEVRDSAAVINGKRVLSMVGLRDVSPSS